MFSDEISFNGVPEAVAHFIRKVEKNVFAVGISEKMCNFTSCYEYKFYGQKRI